MSEHHAHHHLARASATGDSLDDALFNAVAGLTDAKGHHPGVSFDTFEIIRITGTIDHPRGDHGKPGGVRVLIDASGHHD